MLRHFGDCAVFGTRSKIDGRRCRPCSRSSLAFVQWRKNARVRAQRRYKSRLRRGGTRLLEEERFRRKFAATYPTLLTKVKNLISQWETRQKLPFKVGNAALGDLVNDVLQCHKALTAGSRLHKAEAIRLATLIDRAQGADKKHIAEKNDDENVMHAS